MLHSIFEVLNTLTRIKLVKIIWEWVRRDIFNLEEFRRIKSVHIEKIERDQLQYRDWSFTQ